MADSSNLNNVELNGLPKKSDSLPNDWMITVINPKTGETSENMTIARFKELLPFLLKAGGELTGTVKVHPSLEIKGNISPLQFNNNNSPGGYFSGVKWSSFDRKEALFSAGVFTASDGEKYTDARYCIGWGVSPWNLSDCLAIGKDGVWYKGRSLLTSVSSVKANALTETVVEEVPVSANTPMTLQEDGQTAPVTQTIERYEYSIPKMAEAILALQKELEELKGGVGK